MEKGSGDFKNQRKDDKINKKVFEPTKNITLVKAFFQKRYKFAGFKAV
jgi:hypothetical protein